MNEEGRAHYCLSQNVNTREFVMSRAFCIFFVAFIATSTLPCLFPSGALFSEDSGQGPSKN